MIVEQAEKHFCHRACAELRRDRGIFIFPRFSLFLLLTWQNGFNTYEQFVQKAQKKNLLLSRQAANKSKPKKEIQLFIRRTFQIRIYFGLAAIYYMP